MAGQNVINIVLVGRTGTGKSATGNSILGHKMFDSRYQAGGFNMTCEMYRCATNDGPIINVIDTPGLFSLDVSTDFLNKEIIGCLDMVKEGIHAVLFVLSVTNRISQEDELTFNALQHIFERNILDYFIIVFTGGDELEEEGLTFDEYLGKDCPIFLTNVLKLCGGRKVVFDNRTRNKDKKDAQLKQLLAHVADVKRRTGGKPYTSKLHYKIQDMTDKNIRSASESITNIVLVGRTGNGKSATGNSILGQNLFVSKRSALVTTTECKKFRTEIPDGPIINVIDTPGLDVSADFLNKEIIRCLDMAKEGIHAVLFVLSVKRISQEEELTLNALQRIFGSNILDYFIIVFTAGDELEGLTFDEYLGKDCPIFLTNVLKLCGGRKVVFDNRTWNKDKKDAQLKQLLAHVADVRRRTGGKPYTSELHYRIQEENKKPREQETKIESENLVEIVAAAMKEKSQLEHEKTMKMMQQMKENEMLREKERRIESKKLAQAEEEATMIKEKSQIEYEQTMKMVQKMEEIEKQREKEKEIGYKKLVKTKAEAAVMKRKLLMEHEETNKIVQKMEENEKLREKERDIVSKRLVKVEAEVAVMKENARIEHEQTMKMVQKMEEIEKLKEKEKEIVSKNIAEVKAAAMKEKSQMEHDQNMKMMQQTMEHSLKQIVEAHEKEMSQMREIFQQQQQQQH